MKFVAIVRVGNIDKQFVFHADCALHAQLLLEYCFGIGNVIGFTISFTNDGEHYRSLEEMKGLIKPIKPLSPEKARIKSLQTQKDVATKTLKAERERQKVARAQKQLFSVTHSKTIS